ncbi:hypothetical protein FACS189485_04530 [Spirochaetia bacterium]|nr:hypothetical protein FACS189485_04530 [Spirochaetia bacterium]
MRADQADYDTASSIGRTNGIETIMTGSISRYEGSRYYFDLQIAGTNGNVWDQFTGIIRADKTFRTLTGQ